MTGEAISMSTVWPEAFVPSLAPGREGGSWSRGTEASHMGYTYTKTLLVQSSLRVSVGMNQIGIREDVSSLPGPTQWVKGPVLP